MKCAPRLPLLSGAAVLLIHSIGITSAQTIERFKAADQALDCPAIAQESKPLDAIIAAGDPNNNAVARGAAGAAAGVGGQVGGSMLGSLFGPLG